jgi:MFS family permease
MHSDPRE